MKKILLVCLLLGTILVACTKPTEPKIEPTLPPTPTPTPEPVKVYFRAVIASPTDSESITLKNHSGVTTDVSHWLIGDLNNPSAYSIPNGTILVQDSTIQFGHTTLGFQINDSGERLYLVDTVGNTVDTWGN